jgi:hypothetical protein
MGVWIGLIWLRIEINGWTRSWILGFHKMMWISCVAKQLLASRGRLSSMELFYLIWEVKFHCHVDKSPPHVPTRVRWIQSMLSHPNSLIFVLILSLYLCQDLPSKLCRSGFPTRTLHAVLSSLYASTCFTYLIFRGWILTLLCMLGTRIVSKVRVCQYISILLLLVLHRKCSSWEICLRWQIGLQQSRQFQVLPFNYSRNKYLEKCIEVSRNVQG